MQLYLIDCRYYLRLLQQCFEMMYQVVTHTDSFHSSALIDPLHLFPDGSDHLLHEPVYKIKINIAHIETMQTIFKCFLYVILFDIATPQLGSDEQLFTWNVAFPDRLTNRLLIIIKSGTIDMTVSNLYRMTNCPVYLFIVSPQVIGAQAG